MLTTESICTHNHPIYLCNRSNIDITPTSLNTINPKHNSKAMYTTHPPPPTRDSGSLQTHALSKLHHPQDHNTQCSNGPPLLPPKHNQYLGLHRRKLRALNSSYHRSNAPPNNNPTLDQPHTDRSICKPLPTLHN
jgi:hypothetical protein